MRFDYQITPERIHCLAALLGDRARYTQRFVDELSFLPAGGQQWHRALQIRIPKAARPETPSFWVMPLGDFKRLRLADISVLDAGDKLVNFVTRRQHGEILTEIMTAKYANDLTPLQLWLIKNSPETAELNNSLRSAIYTYLVTLERPTEEWTTDDSEPLFHLSRRYEDLLQSVGVSPEDSGRMAIDFVAQFARESKTAPYLCWVNASPGEVVNLRVSYTAEDPKHRLSTGGLIDLLKSLAAGLLLPIRREGRAARAGWYRQYGLAPIDYVIDVPTLPDRRPSSYYLSLEPPAHTAATFLDWELDNSFNRHREVDCALPAAHVHQGTDVDETLNRAHATGQVRAYLRCAPYRHKQILGATALNVALIWLLSKGELPVGFGEPLQALIIAAPSVLVAFLAQQQRHYYSHVLRRQRALLWIYLFISVTFLVSVAFSERDSAHGAVGLSQVATTAAWALAIASAGVFAWHLPLGGACERVVQYLTERKWEVLETQRQEDAGEAVTSGTGPMRMWGREIRRVWWCWWGVTYETKWECYASASRQYGNFVFLLALAAMISAVFMLESFGDFALKQEPPTSKHVKLVKQEAGWPY